MIIFKNDILNFGKNNYFFQNIIYVFSRTSLCQKQLANVKSKLDFFIPDKVSIIINVACNVDWECIESTLFGIIQPAATCS